MLACNGVPHVRRHDEQLVITFAAIPGFKPQTAFDRHVDMKRTRAAFARTAEQAGVKHPFRRDQHQVAGLAAFVVHGGPPRAALWPLRKPGWAANHSANSAPVIDEMSVQTRSFRDGA